MALLVEVVVDGGVDGCELLQGPHPAEPQHRPLSSSERLVAIFGSVVGPAAYLLAVGIADLLQGRLVGSQAVGGDRLRAAMPLHGFLDERQGGPFVALLGDEGLEHLTFVVHRTPEALDLLNDRYKGGLHLQATHDGHMLAYNRICWAPVAEQELRRQLTERAIRKPEVYGDNPDILVSGALKIIRSLQSSALPQTEVPVINTEEGELWLNADGTFQRRPHRPESGLRSMVAAPFDPTAEAPLFQASLAAIFSKAAEPEEMARHMLEIMAYAVQPLRDIPMVVALTGGGSNGKSMLLRILIAIVGQDQVYAAGMEVLKDQFNLPDLAGKTLMIDDDANEGGKWADGAIKKLTGGGVIMARRVRASAMLPIKLTALPIVAMNGAPNLADTSHGMARRIYTVPFARRFEGAEKDPNLAEKIIEAELPGVLNLLLAALERLRTRGGFDEPAECVVAREEMLAAANPLRAFRDEACERKAGRPTRVSTMRSSMQMCLRPCRPSSPGTAALAAAGQHAHLNRCSPAKSSTPPASR